ncbi:MAG: bifunctional demethylmenaquinone methyltransferase/2-methoxy-6-polyprenyl-1,4-benzoquinol methylase UbiE [Mariniblastus sp.]
MRETEPIMVVDKSNERVRKMFGEIAPKYDRMNHLLSMNVDRYWRWKSVRKLKPNQTDPILDVCTGTGDLAFSFHKYTDGKVPVVGSDFCYEMLEVGREKSNKTERVVSFVEADAQNLPFEDDRFQVVSAAFGLRNVADTDLGLREMTRVCQPGGKVAILEFSVPRYQPVKGLYGWYFKNILPRIGQWMARNDSSAYSYLPDSVGEFPCYEQLTERMLKAGLSTAKFYPLTFGIATLYIGTK